MSIGTTTNTFKSKVFTGTIIVCGKETVALNIEGAQNIPVKKDGTTTKVIESTEIESFFKVEPGSESHSECGIVSYQLVNENGSEITGDPIVNYADGALTI